MVSCLIACGWPRLALRRARTPGQGLGLRPLAGPGRSAERAAAPVALAWTAFKVGALSYGGGFVIVPLMQADAVNRYHWMTGPQFLNAVALGQVTPGPVVQTVAVVGYAAAGLGGGLLAALVAFSPSFAFILAGGKRFDRLRRNEHARTFLNGAGPAAIGAILGSAIPLARALTQPLAIRIILAAAAVLLLASDRASCPHSSSPPPPGHSSPSPADRFPKLQPAGASGGSDESERAHILSTSLIGSSEALCRRSER